MTREQKIVLVTMLSLWGFVTVSLLIGGDWLGALAVTAMFATPIVVNLLRRFYP